MWSNKHSYTTLDIDSMPSKSRRIISSQVHHITSIVSSLRPRPARSSLRCSRSRRTRLLTRIGGPGAALRSLPSAARAFAPTLGLYLSFSLLLRARLRRVLLVLRDSRLDGIRGGRSSPRASCASRRRWGRSAPRDGRAPGTGGARCSRLVFCRNRLLGLLLLHGGFAARSAASTSCRGGSIV